MTSSSLTPAFTSRSASAITWAAGRLASSPRSCGMMQNEQRLLQPSEIFKIGVVARREAQALRRHQIEERIVQRRHRVVHGRHHLLVLMRPGDGQHAGMRGAGCGPSRRRSSR